MVISDKFSEIQWSVWSDNYVIRFMWYELDLIIRVMTVGNCVFVCIYGLYVYFAVPFSFGDWYLSHPFRLTAIE